MPLDELIEKLCAIQIEYGDDNVQVWMTDAEGEECRVSEVKIIPGKHMIQVNLL